MVRINKSEAKWLLSKGFKFEEHVHKTHSSHPTYYVTEGKALKMLNAYRDSRIVESRS